jgi:hypothetical protein
MNSPKKKTNSGTNARRISSPAMSHSARHQQTNQRLTIPTYHAVVVHYSSKTKKKQKKRDTEYSKQTTETPRTQTENLGKQGLQEDRSRTIGTHP